jgi:protein-disulfide isomerase
MKVKINLWAIAIVVGILGLVVWKNLAPSDETLGAFAQCLADKGVVMYGSKYCGHCNNQKKMFGDSFKYITYIECTEQMQTCQDNGITGVPAWIINGQKYTGEQSIERLSQLSGCELTE